MKIVRFDVTIEHKSRTMPHDAHFWLTQALFWAALVPLMIAISIETKALNSILIGFSALMLCAVDCAVESLVSRGMRAMDAIEAIRDEDAEDAE